MDQKALKKLVESISNTVKTFKKNEIECLIRLFYSLVKTMDKRLDNVGLDRNAFRGILHNIFGMTDDMLMNRVFFAFDKDKDNCINVKEWVKGLSVFLRGTFEEKLKFCFEVYYLNGDGYISREKIFDLLKNSLHQQSSEEEGDEGIRDLVDIALKKMDYDNDGKISFTDFEKAVKEERLLLEVFGPCLPEAKKNEGGVGGQQVFIHRGNSQSNMCSPRVSVDYLTRSRVPHSKLQIGYKCLDFEALAFRYILTSSF